MEWRRGLALGSRPDSEIVEAPRELSYLAPVPVPGVLTVAAGFARTRWARLVVVSLLVLVPCFWHHEIEAADLGSHLYNAWLVQLIHRGEVHGLWIDHRSNNVLFDYLLSAFGALFGLHIAEKIAVATAVLVFFWGVFALVCAATRRAPWYLLPLAAMAAYGWTFYIGVFNYYLALGLSFFALAIVWRGRRRERLIALALAPLIVFAHPLALFWLLGAGLYILLAEGIPRLCHMLLIPLHRIVRFRLDQIFLFVACHLLLFLAGVAALFGIHEYLGTHYIVEARPHNFWFFNGADQFVLFGNRYHIVEYAFLAFVAAALLFDLAARLFTDGSPSGGQAGPSSHASLAPFSEVLTSELGAWWPHRLAYTVPFALYLLLFAAVLLLPHGAHIPGHIGAVALLTDRLTSVSLAVLLCLLGALKPRKWHLAAAAALAAVFFAFVYQDTGRINRMEIEIARLVRTLPPGRRVMGTILPPRNSRVTIQHILDRACIGYCYSYGNYEPGSKMFRVRAVPGNPYVLANYDLAIEMERGHYLVRAADLPVDQVYPCGSSAADLLVRKFCIAPLQVGEQNNAPASKN